MSCKVNFFLFIVSSGVPTPYRAPHQPRGQAPDKKHHLPQCQERRRQTKHQNEQGTGNKISIKQ